MEKEFLYIYLKPRSIFEKKLGVIKNISLQLAINNTKDSKID